MKWVVSFSSSRPFGPFPVNTMLRAGKDEHFAITCSDDKTVRLWDVRTGKQHRKFVGHQDYVFACSVHPTSTLFCSGSFDETIKLWDPRCPEAVREIKAHAEPITGVQFSPGDGSVIASGSYDGLTRLWDTASGSCLVTIYAEQAGLPAKQAPVSGLRYSPNGSYLLVSTHDTFMRLWRVDTQPVRASRFFEGCRSLRYNCNNVFHAPKNRDAPVVVAGQEDGCLMIFDMNTGKLAHEVQAHRSPVLGMDNHPRNSMFVSCSMDKDNLARVWRYESHFSGREGDPDIRPAAPLVTAPDDFVVPPVRQSYAAPGAMDVG